MKIVMTAINPLFPHKVMGGAPRHLQEVAEFLSQSGHEVVILCTSRSELPPEFFWPKGSKVRPVFRFKQPFPQPYAIATYEMAANLEILDKELLNADRFYQHDGEILPAHRKREIPVIVSLRDHVYPETLLASYLMAPDCLILPSDYSRRTILAGPGRFFPELHKRIRVIPNGFDLREYCPGICDKKTRNLLQLDSNSFPVLLHPHRPEPDKGLLHSLEITARLRDLHGFSEVKLLVPKWFDESATPELKPHLAECKEKIVELKLQDQVIFHPWIPLKFMPDYYRAGDICLSPGTFVESFGNTPYEAMLCGTPALAAAVSTHREILPTGMLPLFEPGNCEEATEIAAKILSKKKRVDPSVLQYLRDKHCRKDMVQHFAKNILNCKKCLPLTRSALSAKNLWMLSPWCNNTPQGFYHDYLKKKARDTALEELIISRPAGFKKEDVSDEKLWDKWKADGWISPSLQKEAT